jgi:hypothetical protein
MCPSSAIGLRTVLRIKITLVVLLLIYAALHYFLPDFSSTKKSGRDFVRVDRFGFASVKSQTDIDWYLGADNSEAHLQELKSNNDKINILRYKLLLNTRDLLNIAHRLSNDNNTVITENPLSNLRLYSTGDDLISYEQAASSGDPSHETVSQEGNVLPTLARNVEKLWKHTALTKEESQTVGDTLFSIRQLIDLRKAQFDTLDDMKTPDGYIIFWMSPWGMIAESVFWTLFGVIASLLYNTCYYIKKGIYNERENPIIWAKFFYAPIVTVVFILMIWIELIGGIEPSTRIWSIPLLGFLIGMNCRKAIDATDNISANILRRFQREADEKNKTVAKTSSNSDDKTPLSGATPDSSGNSLTSQNDDK